MAQPKQGDTVKVHYTGKLDDGTVFDSSKNRSPLEFKIGEKKVIPGFEEAVINLNPGETKTIKIKADDAYGQYRNDLVITVDKKNLPQNLEPKIGQNLQIKQENDQIIIVTVTGITDSNVTLDANHPLAGKDLTFEIELVEIV